MSESNLETNWQEETLQRSLDAIVAHGFEPTGSLVQRAREVLSEISVTEVRAGQVRELVGRLLDSAGLPKC